MAAAPGIARPTRSSAAASRGPVVLATLGVPFDPDAVSFAIDSAVESGQPLILANVVELPPLALSVRMGYDQLDDPHELAESLRAPAELARSLGVHVERLRVRSPRPVVALLEVVAERAASLLVFGPDRSTLRPRAYRKAAQVVRERAPCLVWIAPDLGPSKPRRRDR